MCILLKLDYAKFGVSNLFLSKGIEEKPLGVGSTPSPPLGTGRVNKTEFSIDRSFRNCFIFMKAF